jgi:hypothetical protein
MAIEKFRYKYFLFLVIFFFCSCMSNKEKALSDAYSCFDNQIEELKLNNISFEGPIKLNLFEKKYFPKKGHIIYGWKSVAKQKEIWIYVDIDTNFVKEPSLSYSNNFFEQIDNK